MRHSNGGAHAANNLRCYVYSTLSVLACLQATRWAIGSGLSPYLAFFALILPFSLIVFRLSPVEDYNKPIEDDRDRKTHRDNGLATLSICMIASVVVFMLELPSFGCVVGCAIILTIISMVIGSAKNAWIDRQAKR